MFDAQKLILHQSQLMKIRNLIQFDYNEEPTLSNTAKLRIINEEITKLGNWIRELHEEKQK